MLLAYYLIALLIVFASLEYYVVHREHSYEQRFLPLVLGLAVVYLFYLIVEYVTNATAVFAVLKHLLLLQLVYLIFYYILDFTHIVLPMWLNVLLFSGIGIGNIVLCIQIKIGYDYRPVVLSIVFAYGLIAIALGGITIYKRSKLYKVHLLYKLLYVGLLLPTVSIILAETEIVREEIIVPASIILYTAIVIYLMVSGKFYQTGEYLKEDFFARFEGNLILFDADFSYIDASRKAKEMFPEDVADLEAHPNNYQLMSIVREWAKEPDIERYNSYKGRYIRCRFYPVTRKNSIQGYILNIDDITNEKKELEAVKLQTKQKSEFLANMSHELRSPLNAIIGGSDVILAKRDMSETSRVMLTRISDAGRNLLDIVNSILDYSKLEVGNLELIDNTYDLKGIVERITYNAANNIKDKKLTFTIAVKDSVPRVLIGDKNRVNVVLKNVVYNAINTTVKGAVECEITTETIDDEKIKIIFKCRDSGPGMTEEEQKNVFAKYVSFNDQTIAESTGIGLYLAGQLCEMMQGEAKAESDGKNGSTITVSFVQKIGSKEKYRPFTVTEAIINSDYETAQELVKPDWIYPEANVLVVDDMKVNREIFAARAEKWKINLLEAESGYEAIEMVRDNDTDLIIMDQMMPNMSGLEAYEEIRKFSKVPAVLLTANTSDGLAQECINRGFAGYMAKPIKLTVLKRMLEDNLPEKKRVPFVDDSTNAFLDNAMDPNFVYVLEAYIEDVEEIMPRLHEYFETDLDMFRVKVHGIKGISRQIGKYSIGDSAEIMEMAAKASHKDYISKHLDAFIADLNIILEETKFEYEKMAKDMNI